MLNTLERLEQAAYDNGISIHSFHFSETKKAACYQDGELKTIILDKPLIASPPEERELLAEELGHYLTGSLYPLDALYNTEIARVNRAKCEAKANRWAIKEILPATAITEALQHGAKSDFEIAEYCNVTFGFLCKAVDYYKAKGIGFRGTQ